MPTPDFKKLLHFITQSQWIIGFHQSGENKQQSNDPADQGNHVSHALFFPSSIKINAKTA